MTARKNVDHWDLLASELGAAPPLEESNEPEVEQPEAKQPEAATVPVVAPVAEAPVAEPVPPTPEPAAPRVVQQTEPVVAKPRTPKAPEPRPLSDWDLLADELGITPQEPPRAEVVEVSHAPKATQFAAEVFNDRSIRFEESVEIFEKAEVGREQEEVASEQETAEPEEYAKEADEGEPRRRRRRRRRKPRGGQEAPGEPESADQPEEVEEVFPQVDLTEDFESPSTSAEDAEPAGFAEPVAEEGGPSRPRRRRSRRGGRKGRTAETSEPVQEEVAEEAVEEVVEEFAEEAPPPRREEKGKRRPRREGPRAKRPRETQAEPVETDEDAGDDVELLHEGHRGIPTWQEAISLIVDANLEARAKRPDSGRSRGHGGGRDNQGRRDQRGSGRRH